MDFVHSLHNLIPSVPAHPTEVDVFKYLKSSDHTLFNHLMKDPHFYSSLYPFPGFEEIVQTFNVHDTYIISARPKPVHDATIKQVLDLGIEPIDFVFTNKKGKATEDLRLDIMIEDQSKYARQVPIDVVVIMPVRSYNSDYVHDKNNKVIAYNTPQELEEIINMIDTDRRHHAY